MSPEAFLKEFFIDPTPLGRMAQPLDVAQAVSFLASDEASFIFDTIAELRKCGYSGWLISENFYDCGPVSRLSDDPIELMLKDCQVMKSIAW